MKKILYIITNPHYGGAQKYVRDLALNLPRSHFKAAVAVGQSDTQDHHWLEELRTHGIEVIRLNHVFRELSPIHDILSGWELFKLFRRLHVNVVHLNSSKVGATGAVMAAIHNALRSPDKRTKIIYTVHGLVLNEPLPLWRKAYYWLAEWFGAGFKDRIICVSQQSKDAMLRYRLANHDKLLVLPVGVDFDRLKFLAKEKAREQIRALTTLNLLPSDLVVGTIAGLYKTKGLKYLIAAAQILFSNNPQLEESTKFIVIGSGPEKINLKALIYEHGLERNFVIAEQNENAAQLLKAFDLFVLPSVKEGLPYTLIEARAAGLPIVASQVGGVPEVIEHKKTGFTVEPANPHELAEAIKTLLGDESLRQQLAAATPKNLEPFSLGQMVKATAELY